MGCTGESKIDTPCILNTQARKQSGLFQVMDHGLPPVGCRCSFVWHCVVGPGSRANTRVTPRQLEPMFVRCR